MTISRCLLVQLHKNFVLLYCHHYNRIKGQYKDYSFLIQFIYWSGYYVLLVLGTRQSKKWYCQAFNSNNSYGRKISDVRMKWEHAFMLRCSEKGLPEKGIFKWGPILKNLVERITCKFQESKSRGVMTWRLALIRSNRGIRWKKRSK